MSKAEIVSSLVANGLFAENERPWLNSMAEPRLAAMAEAMQAVEEEKASLISGIVANQANVFSEAFLRGKDLTFVRGVACLAGVRGVVTNRDPGEALPLPGWLADNAAAGHPVTNAGQEVLSLPRW